VRLGVQKLNKVKKPAILNGDRELVEESRKRGGNKERSWAYWFSHEKGKEKKGSLSWKLRATRGAQIGGCVT